MEKEQLIEVIKLYKQYLADAMEEKMVFQVLVNQQAKQLQELEQQIQNLNAQLAERETIHE